MYWSVTSTDVTTIRPIVGSIVKNQAPCEKCLISEAIVDTVRFCIYCCGYGVDEFLKVELDHMVEEQDGLGESKQLRRTLEDTHMKMRENVNSKLSE